jgi:hypothetical protein
VVVSKTSVGVAHNAATSRTLTNSAARTVGVAYRPARKLSLPCTVAARVKAKANAPNVPPWTNAAETPAGRVTCDRPILARVAGVTERVMCQRSVSMVRDPYLSFWGDFQTVARPVEVSNRDRSVGIDVLYKLSGRCKAYTILDFSPGAFPSFFGAPATFGGP